MFKRLFFVVMLLGVLSPMAESAPLGRVVVSVGELQELWTTGYSPTAAPRIAKMVLDMANANPSASLLCVSVRTSAAGRTDQYGNPLRVREIHNFWYPASHVEELLKYRAPEFYARSDDFMFTIASFRARPDFFQYVSECGGLPPKEWEQ